MSINPISDEDLWAALRPCRVDPQAFEAGIHFRITTNNSERAAEPWAGFSPWLRAVAALLPLPVLGCRGTIAAAKLAPTSASAKLLGYLAFPAISLFVLLGATVLSVLKIRGVRWQNSAAIAEREAQNEAVRQWWRDHKWGAGAVFVASLALASFGATWLLFLFYILSFGILLYVIAAFARLGIGNRLTIGSSCLTGLIFLGQTAGFPGVGASEIHFLDQSLVQVVFFGGTLAMVLLLSLIQFDAARKTVTSRSAFAFFVACGTIVLTLFASMVVSLMVWRLYPTIWTATPARIKQYVESFDDAPFKSSSWRKWEIPASWAIQSHLNPDFSKPRQLLASEIAGEQNPFILGSAIRVGLLSADQAVKLKAYEAGHRSLVESSPSLGLQALTSLEQQDWIIRAAAQHNDLSRAERDVLEQRLHATMETMINGEYVTLRELLLATQLLAVIQRPVDPDQYRAKIHDLLREFHSLDYGGFELAGGFRRYRQGLVRAKHTWTQLLLRSGMPGDPEATSDAVELMAIYGIPDGLDLNWVRSFSRPKESGDPDRKWMDAVTLDRLNHLKNAPQPTWLQYLYYERTLLAAFVLVGLCLFATVSSPILKTTA